MKIPTVATSKTAICRSICPWRTERTAQGWINIVTDLGDNHKVDISVGGGGGHLLIKAIGVPNDEFYVISPSGRLLSAGLHD